MPQPTSFRSRTPLAAVVALVALTFVGCGSDTEPAADPPSSSSPEVEAPDTETGQGDASTTDLSVDPLIGASRCMAPNVPLLATQDTALEGTVTEIVDGTATLTVDHWFKGVESETVTVSAPSGTEQELLQAVDFREGQTYLISSTDGQLSVCGMSAPKDDILTKLYEQAFPG